MGSSKGVCDKCKQPSKKLHPFKQFVPKVGEVQFNLCNCCAIQFLDICEAFVQGKQLVVKKPVKNWTKNNTHQCWNCKHRRSHGLITRDDAYYRTPYCSKFQEYMTSIPYEQCKHFEEENLNDLL